MQIETIMEIKSSSIALETARDTSWKILHWTEFKNGRLLRLNQINLFEKEKLQDSFLAMHLYKVEQLVVSTMDSFEKVVCLKHYQVWFRQ